MPGLVVVFGDPQAESVATRAAQPLLRRPWERLSILLSADGTTALGFAGERGGVARDETTGSVAALDGEFYGPVRSGPAAAGELLSLYLRDGTELEPPEGSFAAAVCDGRTGSLVLFTDPFAGRPLFLADGREPVLAAGELKAIVSAGFRPELDLQALAEVLAYRWTLADRTLVAGIRELPGGTTLVLDGEHRTEARRWRFRVEPEEGADVRELAAEFGRLLAAAVEARLEGSESLALSGGLDSRCIAAQLAGLGFEGVAATHGMPGTPELAPAARVAEAVGLHHRFLPLESGHTARWAPACVWLTDGRKWPFSTREVAFRRIRSELGSRALMMGTRGDDVVRLLPVPAAGATAEAFAVALHRRLARGSDGTLDDVLEPELAAALRGRAAAALAEQLASDGGDRQALYAKIRFGGGAWVISPGLYDDHLVPRHPFADRKLGDFCSRLPYGLRLGGRLQRAYLGLDPLLARVPFLEEPGPVERFGIALRRLARPGRIVDLLGPSASLLDLLLEPRTISRGQIQQRAVERLVGKALRGRPDVHVLSGLLRLEILQRQLLDGDGPPDEA